MCVCFPLQVKSENAVLSERVETLKREANHGLHGNSGPSHVHTVTTNTEMLVVSHHVSQQCSGGVNTGRSNTTQHNTTQHNKQLMNYTEIKNIITVSLITCWCETCYATDRKENVIIHVNTPQTAMELLLGLIQFSIIFLTINWIIFYILYETHIHTVITAYAVFLALESSSRHVTYLLNNTHNILSRERTFYLCLYFVVETVVYMVYFLLDCV